MLDQLSHVLLPAAVIGSAVALCVTGHIDGPTALATIATAGGVGAAVVSAAHKRSGPP